MDHCFATAAEVAGARVLTEVLDLISTEQMTELTAFRLTDRIVRDARTKIDERWSTFRVQRCGMFSSEHTLEALVVCSDFWEDRFSRPKFSEKNQPESTTLLRANGNNRREWLVMRLERKGSIVERSDEEIQNFQERWQPNTRKQRDNSSNNWRMSLPRPPMQAPLCTMKKHHNSAEESMKREDT